MNIRLLSVLLFVIYSGDAIALWWSLETSLEMDPNNVCRGTQSLLHRRQEFCKSKPEVISTVLSGINTSVEECQYQFRNRRWNCSTSKNFVKKIVRYDNRETAFIYAITSAGITFSVTRACSSGHLPQCSCRKVVSRRHSNDVNFHSGNSYPPTDNNQGLDGRLSDGENQQFEWGGCSDNIEYGYAISKQFTADEHSRDGRAMVIAHNNEAGRLAVRRYMQTECKCHGLSGSCSVKTCRKKMPHFREVGDRLKARFDGAIKVLISNKGDKLIEDGETIKPPTEVDLVYTTESPDFCTADPRTGSHGTAGRRCNDTSNGVGGCQLLCCNREKRMTKMVITENCQCRFKWCCTVQCKRCTREEEVYTCE